MNHISKPHLVDLLRIFDKRKYFVPRIRYASVRSKPELLKDLHNHFRADVTDTEVIFTSKQSVPVTVPAIRYHLKDRKFYFDEVEVDVPTHSRLVPTFEIRHVPTTLHFYYAGPPCPEALEDPLSTCTAAVSLSESPTPSIHDLSDCSS